MVPDKDELFSYAFCTQKLQELTESARSSLIAVDSQVFIICSGNNLILDATVSSSDMFEHLLLSDLFCPQCSQCGPQCSLF